MYHMNPYQKARQLIQDVIYPDGCPLEFGCEVEFPNRFPNKIYKVIKYREDGDGNKKIRVIGTHQISLNTHEWLIDNGMKILGKEPQLAEVLRAIENGEGHASADSGGTLVVFENEYDDQPDQIQYNLQKPLLKDQTQECWAFIIKILSV